MTVTIRHSTVVDVPDDGSSPVGTDEWNASHTISGGATGQFLGAFTGSAADFITITGSHLPNPSTTTLGGVFSLPVTSNSVLSGIGNDGTPTRATTTGTGDVVRATNPTITGLTFSGALVVTSNASGAFAVGPNGLTNPVLQVDGSTASQATGAKLTGQTAASALVNLEATSSGATASWAIDAKGAGTINFGINSTGTISCWRATNFMNGTGTNYFGSSSGFTSLNAAATASGALTLPSATDTLVGRATTDTLTNKTLTSATLATKLTGGVFTIAQSGAAVSHTGTTSETTIATIAIPANVMGSNGKVRIEALFSYSGGLGTWRPRFKFGGTTFHEQAAFSSGGLSARLDSQFTNANATNAQVAAALIQANFASNANAYTTMAIDTTSSQNLTITMELGNAGDTVVLRSYTVELVLPP